MFSGLWPNFKGALGVAPPGERCGGNSKKQKKKHVSVFPPVAWPPLADNVIHSLASQLKAHPIFHYGTSPGVRVVDPRARRNSPHFTSLLFNLATSLNSFVAFSSGYLSDCISMRASSKANPRNWARPNNVRPPPRWGTVLFAKIRAPSSEKPENLFFFFLSFDEIRVLSQGRSFTLLTYWWDSFAECWCRM